MNRNKFSLCEASVVGLVGEVTEPATFSTEEREGHGTSSSCRTDFDVFLSFIAGM